MLIFCDFIEFKTPPRPRTILFDNIDDKLSKSIVFGLRNDKFKDVMELKHQIFTSVED